MKRYVEFLLIKTSCPNAFSNSVSSIILYLLFLLVNKYMACFATAYLI